MLALTIVNLQIVVKTHGGIFSTNIPFKDGLNIIRAENSSGKSTCVNAIAYGLGLEAILGPSRKRPFPTSLYEMIYDSKESKKQYFVSGSSVALIIKSNRGGTAKVIREIRGDHNKVTVLKDGISADYFLGSSGSVGVGSAASENGFHHWLANFIDWNLPEVVTFDGREAKLYLECIFPLFFIEQKRGWSEIQANTPTHYGIRNVKRAAAEYCLAIDSFEHDKKVAVLKTKMESALNEWNGLRTSAEGIADFNGVRMAVLPELSDEGGGKIEFMYMENNVYISVFDQERSLKRVVLSLSDSIKAVTPQSDSINETLAIIRRIRRDIEEHTDSMEMVRLSIEGVDSKLSILSRDHNQYLQLKRLKTVGSKIDLDINTEKCPVCESDLYDTLGKRASTRKPMTLEENIEFLKNQKDFFSSIRQRHIEQLTVHEAHLKLLELKLRAENEKLASLREDMEDISGEARALLRDKIHAELLLKEVLKLKESQVNLSEQASRVHANWCNAAGALKKLRKGPDTTASEKIIGELESIVKGNLSSFHFNNTVGDISISRHSLRPEQEGYDIVAETSASDYIRIIWAYTLALSELASSRKMMRHGGFVVFDEPRQHEASMISFTNLMNKAAESKSYGGQVIIATSLKEEELRASCIGKEVNLICFNDYILTQISENNIGEI